MKPPTAPPIYPELPIEDGQIYRLQKISEIEKQLIKREMQGRPYTRSINGVSISLIELMQH